MHKIHGKVVATGGARGIGYAIAKRLIADGASVAIGDIDDVQLKQAAADLGIATYALLDVTDPTSFTTFLDRVERDLGPLDVLVNNAGIMPIGHFHLQTDDATRRVVEINVLGAMYGSRRIESDAAAGQGPHHQHRVVGWRELPSRRCDVLRDQACAQSVHRVPQA